MEAKKPWECGVLEPSAAPALRKNGISSEPVIHQTKQSADFHRSVSSQSDEGVVADCPNYSGAPILGISNHHEDFTDADRHLHNTSSSDSSDDEIDMRVLRNRIESYRSWPVSYLSPTAMAACGFYYTGIADRVRCTYCGGILCQWSPGDDPSREHKRCFPHCMMNRRNSAVEDRSQLLQRVESAGEDVCGLFQTLRSSQPVSSAPVFAYPEMVSYRDRFATFATWPVDKTQQPRDLAVAGLFYTGEGDRVQCFDCGQRLERWDDEDAPWTEHARWYPTCRFVIANKGQEFVDQVQEQYSSSSGIEDASSQSSSSTRSSPSDISPSDDDLEEVVVSAALRQNCDMNLIVQALEEHRRDFRFARFRNADQLVEAVRSIENRKKIQKEMIEKAKLELSLEAAQPLPETDIAKENERLKNERRCKVCLDKDAQIIFTPCGHLACCSGCALILDKCPVCRRSIKTKTRVFFT